MIGWSSLLRVAAVFIISLLFQNAAWSQDSNRAADDPKTWSEEAWASQFKNGSSRAQWLTLGKSLQKLEGSKDLDLIRKHWSELGIDAKCFLLQAYTPSQNGSLPIDQDVFQLLRLAYSDEDRKVVKQAANLIDAFALAAISTDAKSLARWIKKWKGKTADEIIRARCKYMASEFEDFGRFDVRDHLADLLVSTPLVGSCNALRGHCQMAGITKRIEQWKAKGWMDGEEKARDLIATAFAHPVDDGPAIAGMLQVGDDKKMRYFLYGLRDKADAPKEGYKICFILPGGDGSADFRGFCKTIHENQVPKGYLTVQLVAPVWSEKVRVVWPTESLNPAKARFTTEEFLTSVLADVSKKAKVNKQFVIAMGWSSGGPPIYRIATQKNSPLKGIMPVMSVFSNLGLDDLSETKGKPFFILHSPEDWIKMDQHAEVAEKQLKAAGARVELQSYEGGHGWRGDSIKKIGVGLKWIDQQLKESAER